VSETFIDAVLSGDALWVDVEDWVAGWHAGRGEGKLHEHLGMSWDEYRLWVERPEVLRLIVGARETHEPVERYIAEVDDFAIAARGLEPRDREAVVRWLRSTGRLPED